MAGGINKLTVRRVAAMSPGDAPLSDGGGLRVAMNKSGSKKWIWRYSLNGRPDSISCGGDSVTLAEARATRDKYKAMVDRGQNPKSQQVVKTVRVDKVSVTLGEFAPKWFKEVKKPELKQTTPDNIRKAATWLNMVETHGEAYWATPLENITPELVVEALRPLREKNPSTFNRVLNRSKQIFDGAKGQKLLPLQAVNPFQRDVIKHLISLPKKGRDFEVKNYPSMPFSDCPKFFTWLLDKDAMSARCLRFLMMTGGRSQEALRAQWQEFNFRKRTWTIPGERMKTSRDHTVSLPDDVMAELEPLKGWHATYVFPGDRGAISSTALDNQLKDYCKEFSITDLDGIRRPVKHGFRTSFKLWSVRYGIEDLLSEAQLSHKPAGESRAAYLAGYQFDKEREKMLHRWCRFLHGDKDLFD